MQPRLCLIDDDSAVRNSLQLVMSEAKIPLVVFSSARDFLQRDDLSGIGCILLNERMPAMTGSELQRKLRERGVLIPIIFLSGYADVPFVVRVVKAGAFSVVEKPFHETDLLEQIQQAFAACEKIQKARRQREVIDERLGRLSRREIEVLNLMVAGQKNKDIAKELKISPKTLDIHRAKIMEKMEARTVADVVRWRLYALAGEEKWPEGVGYL